MEPESGIAWLGWATSDIFNEKLKGESEDSVERKFSGELEMIKSLN